MPPRANPYPFAPYVSPYGSYAGYDEPPPAPAPAPTPAAAPAPRAGFMPTSYLDRFSTLNRLRDIPQAAPGTETEFWRNVLKPKTWLPDFPKLGQMGMAMSGVGPALEVGQDLSAALEVLSGGEDPVTAAKPPAGKPAPPKVNPVPANASGGPVQKSGPADEDTTAYDQMGAIDYPMSALPEPPPPAPEAAPGQVKVRLADGREFDYGAGESIPVEEQGKFGTGHLTRMAGYPTASGFVKTGEVADPIGGTGKPGGFMSWRTPESDAMNLARQAAITKAAAYAREAFPEITAKAAADTGVRVADENARRAVDQQRLEERLKAEQKAQALNDAFENWRINEERKVSGWEANAQKLGTPEAIQKAEQLRLTFEREAKARRDKLDRDLAVSGALPSGALSGIFRRE